MAQNKPIKHYIAPIDRSVNRSLGSQIAHILKKLPDNAVIRNFKIS